MKIPLFLYSTLMVLSSYSQEVLRFKHITRSNGSSIISVQSFHQDAHGYVWMSSGGSDLIRFDGTNLRQYGFEVFETNQFKNSRGVFIFEDSKQQLWVATDVGSLFQYNRDQDVFTLANDSTTSPNARIFSFAQAPDGSFWLGSMGEGLVNFHPETKIFKQYKAERGNTDSLPDNFITGLAYDDGGLLWVGTTGGLCSYDSKTDHFTTYPLSNINPDDTYRYRVIRSLLLSKDKIYLSSYGGLHVFDKVLKKSKHFIHDPNDRNSLSHNSTFKIVEADDGKFWIATYGGGLNLFDPVTQQFIYWKNDPFNSESLSSNNLFSIYLDKTGLLWIGAADNTVSVHNTHFKKFHNVKNLANEPDGISSGWIRALHQENDSVFWLGFNGQGVNKFNLNTGKADKFVNDPKNPNSLSHNAISGFSKDATGNLWIALEGGGLNKLDPATKKITRYLQGKNSINNNAISALLVDRDNMLWATAYRSGLNIYDIYQDKFKTINNDSLLERTGISLAFVEDIFELNGTIWFNAQNQVVLYDKARNQFIKVAEAGRVVQADNPFYLEIKPYTETEMLLLTKDEARAIRYISPDSIISQPLFKMDASEGLKSFVLHKEEIWYNTYNQLVRWNPKLNKRQSFTRADGIIANNLNTIFKDNQGRIFVSSLDGLSWFYPDQIDDDTLARKIVFTDFKLFNQSATQAPDSVYNFRISSQPSQLKSVALKHKHSFFSIEFAAQEFMAPEKIQYAYRLLGFDKDWVYVGNRTFASYTNLDPGSYIFEVKATNPDGYWGNDFATLTLIIQPPFWKTWWFLSLVALLIAAIIYSVHRYRLSQSLKVERLRNKIASDLHDEVGSSLTRISIYSDLLQNESSEQDRTNYLSRISAMSREIVSAMSDMVWSIDNRSDSAGALILRMKDFATEILQSKNIEFEFAVSGINEKSILDPVLRQNIYLIFKEAVNNTIKHAGASKVTIELANDPRGFVMTLTDNGKGFDNQKPSRGNGLRNMERRALAVQGQLKIIHNGGTRVIFSRKPL